VFGLAACGINRPTAMEVLPAPVTVTPTTLAPTVETPTPAPSPTPGITALNDDGLKSQINRLAASFLDQTKTAGLGIAVVIRNPQTGQLETMLLNYGTISEGGGPSVTSNTVYEIGSITKIFTGILLAEAVNAGTVKFDDPIQKYLPPGIQAPMYKDIPITLVNLATHHSSLPRDLDSDNLSDLYNWLNTYQLAQAPGSQYVYSNLGYSLLGDILARLSGNDFGTLAYNSISQPLGLMDTSETLSADQKSRLAQGYAVDGSLAAYFPDSGAMSGAGYLHSTLDDMTRFLIDNMRPDSTPLALASSIRLTQMTIANGPDPGSGMGLGWEIDRPGMPSERIWKGGGTLGFTTYISFARDGSSGFVLLTNGQFVDYLVPSMLQLLGENGK